MISAASLAPATFPIVNRQLPLTVPYHLEKNNPSFGGVAQATGSRRRRRRTAPGLREHEELPTYDEHVY
jgi:hypothetical protein